MSLPARGEGPTSEQRALARSRAADGLPTLDEYDLLEEIGHGGMATVYRARDPRLGREVAVKIIHRHLRENAEVGARFVAEARAAAKLRHPGIVEVYDVSSEKNGERYLVVELLRGCTLRKVLQEHRDMPAEIGAAIVLELCDALDHAHTAGIIHRDVKPENVLVELPSDRVSVSPPFVERRTPSIAASDASTFRDGDGVNIKLTDFGIAKVLDAQGVTSTGQVLGSPAHMAPEQIEGGEVDARTDVFGIGVLMYECMVGHLPFEGKNPAQVLRRVLDGIYPEAERERPAVGGRWSRIVAGALAHGAAERTASPRLLGELIRAELSALGVGNPRAEIAVFFADPAGYAAEHPARFVPRIVARAEAARRSGDVQGAAADYNRALALAPHDLRILKKIANLRASSGRRLLARRIAAVGLGSVALGVAAFAVTRAVHMPALIGADGQGAPEPQGPAIDPFRPSLDVPAVAPSATAVASLPRGRAVRLLPQTGAPSAATVASAGAGTSDAMRQVQFFIVPMGAKLVLNGREAAWFGQTFTLTPGPHSVQISVPNSKCCRVHSGSVNVTALQPGEPKRPQRILHRLDMLPSSVSLTGAPPGAQYSCPQIGLTASAGSPQSVTLPDVTWHGRCDFTPLAGGAAPRAATVTLRAGEANAIAWPTN